MANTTYYQDELRYLRDVGPEFARANAEIARYIGDPGSDPDVERILEGVAFMCGDIRRKLDDELPELTASLMALLWPHYLRPIPSMTILELLPDIDQMKAPLTVESGAEFASVKIDGTACRYRSCWPTTLRPWRLGKVHLETALARPVRLVLTLKISPKVKWEDLELGSVGFHLAGDPATAFDLYLLLTAHVDHVTVSDGSARHSRSESTLGPEHIASGGLDRKEGVIPYPARSFVGYRLLQEYFAFKNRFLFVDLTGLDEATRKLDLADTLEIAITFDRRLESLSRVSHENVRLHCVPIINLFDHSADPIRLQHDRVRSLVQPSRSGVADRRHLEIYSIDNVVGLCQSTGLEPRTYEPFYSFTHMEGSAGRASRYYQTHVEPNVLGGDPRLGTDIYLSLISGAAPGQMPENETISIELTCTNRNLPSELRAGDITEPTDKSPRGTSFRNLLKPTATICPPLGKSLHWRLISHMSLNYVSLTNVEHFKNLLRVYDFQSEHDAQKALSHERMFEGIVSLRSDFTERLVRGAPLRGIRVDLELNEDHFAGEGDAFLFASILNRFMGLYVTLNGYSQLNVRLTRSGQVHSFPPRWGDQLTPADTRGYAQNA